MHLGGRESTKHVNRYMNKQTVNEKKKETTKG